MSFWKKSVEAPAGIGSSDAGGPRDASVTPQSNDERAALSTDQLNKLAAASRAMTATFGEVVAMLMRAPQYKHHALADLEWLLAPALRTGQFQLATAQSKENGLTSPVGVVLWASVSEEVDRRLTAAPGQPIRLAPQEWKSGDILWMVTAAGDQRILQSMIKRLQEKEWANRRVKVLVRGKDGVPAVASLESQAA